MSRPTLIAAVGLFRERLEDAYKFLKVNPPVGPAAQRHGDELRLATTPEVCSSVERHLNQPRPVALSNAAREVLAIVAYRQPIAARPSSRCAPRPSDSAIATLLEERPLRTLGEMNGRLETSEEPGPRWMGGRRCAC